MTEFSHRDRRVHRTIARSLAFVSLTVVALAVFAMVVPWPVAGIAGVVALALSGAVYIAWSERVVAEYARDLRSVADGFPMDGFRRVEAGSSVGLERVIGRPSERSPHSGPRSRPRRTVDRPSDESPR
jgi:hypothetical protein